MKQSTVLTYRDVLRQRYANMITEAIRRQLTGQGREGDAEFLDRADRFLAECQRQRDAAAREAQR